MLVVEDDSAMRLLCRLNLELERHRVLEAATLEQARTHLANERIDFVLLDVHVAGECGYDLIGPIRERQDAPIALITGSAQVGSRERELVDIVLPKPFELAELSDVIGRLTREPAQR